MRNNVARIFLVGLATSLVSLALLWIGHNTTKPSLTSLVDDGLVVVKDNEEFYYLFSEKALSKPIVITDSKGNLYYVLSREKILAAGPQAIGILINP